MSTISAGNTTTTALVQTADTTGNLVFATGGANTVALTLNNSQNATFAGTLNTASRGISTAAMPVGSVIQVIQSAQSIQVNTNSNSFVSTGLSASITPQFSTSKIYIIISSTIANTGNGQGNFTIYRNSTNLGGGSSGQASFQQTYSSSGYQFFPIIMSYLDSPATTSSTAYTAYYETQSGGSNTYFGSNNQLSTITLMEIAA